MHFHEMSRISIRRAIAATDDDVSCVKLDFYKAAFNVSVFVLDIRESLVPNTVRD